MSRSETAELVEQHFLLDGFGHEDERAQRRGAHVVHLFGGDAHHDDRHAAERRGLVAQPMQEIETRLSRQVNVGDDQRGHLALYICLARRRPSLPRRCR